MVFEDEIRVQVKLCNTSPCNCNHKYGDNKWVSTDKDVVDNRNRRVRKGRQFKPRFLRGLEGGHNKAEGGGGAREDREMPKCGHCHSQTLPLLDEGGATMLVLEGGSN